jgi:hypothetical protein
MQDYTKRPVSQTPMTPQPPANVVPGSVVSGAANASKEIKNAIKEAAASLGKDNAEKVLQRSSHDMPKDASAEMQKAKLSNELNNVLKDADGDDVGQLKDAMHACACECFGEDVGGKVFDKLFMDPKKSKEYDDAFKDAAKEYKELLKTDPTKAAEKAKNMATIIMQKIEKVKNGEDDPGC